MSLKKTKEKYNYFFAFILGMVIMVIIYILFEATTKSEYRTRTGDTVTTDIKLTSAMTASNIVQTAREQSALAPYLGIEAIPLNSIIADQLEIKTEKGVLVNSVIPNSPAEAGSLKRGDVILLVCS